MKIKTLLRVTLLVATVSPAFADDIGHGRDHDIPDTQPPTEMETTTTESLLQQLLELLEVSAGE